MWTHLNARWLAHDTILTGARRAPIHRVPRAGVLHRHVKRQFSQLGHGAGHHLQWNARRRTTWRRDSPNPAGPPHGRWGVGSSCKPGPGTGFARPQARPHLGGSDPQAAGVGGYSQHHQPFPAPAGADTWQRRCQSFGQQLRIERGLHRPDAVARRRPTLASLRHSVGECAGRSVNRRTQEHPESQPAETRVIEQSVEESVIHNTTSQTSWFCRPVKPS
jgi:hypothetical protein